MSIPHTNPGYPIPAPYRSTRRVEVEDEAISPRRLQQIENATVVMATTLGSSAVFFAVFQYMS